MNDKQLRQAVVSELDYDPSVDSAGIGAQVEDGIVTLTGRVASLAHKVAAERAAWRVKGVRAVVQNIDVAVDGPASDEQIAQRALGLLRWDSTVPDTVHVTVDHGHVTLAGQVRWQFQRANAETDLRHLAGVTGITNAITLEPGEPVRLEAVKEHIEEALRRNAEIEARQIRVAVGSGGTVTLDGRVDTWSERMAVEHAAWSAPGVQSVLDRLTIG
jgi:osmotically-inducible protein OsmY